MSETEGKKAASSWLNVAVDYGPLLVFLGVYKWQSPAEPNALGEVAAIISGTLAFMVAAVAALAVSKWRLGKVSPMLWFSTALIVGFGSLTIFFGDPTFVQMKPTIIYASFGVALAQAVAELGGVLPVPCRAQRTAARADGLRRLAVGQDLGVPAADLPVHLHPDPDAAEARPQL